MALCLQTSGITLAPHQLDGECTIKNGEVKVKKFICSCKAGLGGKCKHTSSVLLQCTRLYYTNLNVLYQAYSIELRLLSIHYFSSFCCVFSFVVGLILMNYQKSSTDVKCIWTKKKEASIEQYKPEPLKDFKCLKFVF